MGMGTCSAGHVETNLQTRGSDFYGEKAGVSEGRDTQLPIIHANSSKGGERNLIFLYRHATSLWHLIAADCVFCVSGVNILSSAQCQHCGSKPGLTAGGLGEAAWQHPVHQVSTVSGCSRRLDGRLPLARDGLEEAGPTASRPSSGPCGGQRGSAAPIADARDGRCPLSPRTAQAPGRGGRSAEPRPGRCSPAPEEPEAGEALVAVPAARRRRPPLGIGAARRPGGGGGGGRGGGRGGRGRAAGRRRLCRLHGRAGGLGAAATGSPPRASAPCERRDGGGRARGGAGARPPEPGGREGSAAAHRRARRPNRPDSASCRLPGAAHRAPAALSRARIAGSRAAALGQGCHHRRGLQRGDGAPASVSLRPRVTNSSVTGSQCH